jgi:hypothetical protein
MPVTPLTCVGTLQLLMQMEAHPACSRYLQRSTSTPWPWPTWEEGGGGQGVMLCAMC